MEIKGEVKEQADKVEVKDREDKREGEDVYYEYTEKPSLDVIDTKRFIDKRAFYYSIENAKAYDVEREILGGVVPHHDIAAYMMADFFKTLSEKKTPDTIFIIGPNHFGKIKKFEVGKFYFDGYDRVVECDLDMTNKLINNPYITCSEKDFVQKEHSMNILLNYVGTYFEEAKVVTLLVGNINERNEFQSIIDSVLEVTDGKECLFVSSIDFSHYLPLEVAEEKDGLTRELLLEMDRKTLLELNSDYLDCPLADVVLLEVLESRGTISCEIMAHDNMANILQRPDLEETTSYFNVLYKKE